MRLIIGMFEIQVTYWKGRMATVEQERNKLEAELKALKRDLEVLAPWITAEEPIEGAVEEPIYYNATIVSLNGDGTLRILFNDGTSVFIQTKRLTVLNVFAFVR